MPKKLTKWPGAVEEQEFNLITDRFFSPVFNGEIWEFADQEVQDLRVRLGLKPTRTRDTLKEWFFHNVKKSAERVNLSVRLRSTTSGFVIQTQERKDS